MFESSNRILQKGKDGHIQYCGEDTNRIVKNLMIYILMPSLVIRCYADYKFRKMDPNDVKEAESYVYIFYNGSYGLWTIFNLMRYFPLPKSC